MQRELPAVLAFLLRGFACGFDRVIGQAREIAFLRDDVGIRVGRIENMIRKRLGKRGLFFLQLSEARLAVFGQFRTGQAEVAQRVL